MKKILFIICAIMTFMACNLIPPDTTVINESSYQVSFKFSRYDYNIILLEQNESVFSKYNYSSVMIVNPEKRIAQSRKQSDNTIILTDLPSWEVRVENKTSSLITLSANGWLENEMVNIIIGDYSGNSSQIGRIYTKSPKFNTTGNLFPVNISYQFVNDICYVKIN